MNESKKNIRKSSVKSSDKKVVTKVKKQIKKSPENIDEVKNSTKKNIPKKNYLFILIIFIISIFMVIGIKICARNYKEYRLSIPVIKGQLVEIKADELDSYINAHNDFYLYIGVSDDINCRKIEKDLPKILKARNIKDETVYLNMSKIDNSKEAIKLKLSQYGEISDKVTYPIFAIFKDGKIKKALNKQEGNPNIGDIEKILDEFEIGVK